MGWSGIRATRGMSNIAVLKQYSSLYKGSTWKGDNGIEMTVEDLAAGGGGVYGVLKRYDPVTETAVRMAMVILVQRRDGEVLWKEMTELEGPNEVRIPERLYKQLSSIDSLRAAGIKADHAADWRVRVDAYLNKKTQEAAIQEGQILEFKEPLRFPSALVTKLKVLSWGAMKRFTALSDTGQELFRCRLSRRTLANAEYRVI